MSYPHKYKIDMQDLIKLSGEKLAELDAMQKEAFELLNLSSDKLTKWQAVYGGSSNELPVGEPFKFVEFKTTVVEENENMNHIVMITDTGHECSLSSLTRLCLAGTRAEDPKFKPSKDGSALEDFAILQGVKSVSPELSSWFNKHKISRELQAKALVGSEQSFTAVATEVLTYFPSIENKNTINNDSESIAEMNAQPATVRQAMCEPKDAYIITLN